MVADGPLLQRVEGDRDGVLDLVGVVGLGDPQPPRRNPRTGCGEEVLQVGERHLGRRRLGGRQRRRHQLAHGRPVAARCPRAGERGPVEGEGVVPAQPPGDEVGLVEGLQRVVGEHVLAHRRGGGAVERVEQLAEGHGGWSLGAGVLAASGVGDDQRLGRGDDRVEQQLAVLGPQVALAGAGSPGQHVVAVDGRDPREHPVVEPDQADHAVGHRAHRHHRADRQRAGAEVGARRPAAQPLLQQGAYVGLPQQRRPSRPRPAAIRASSRSNCATCQTSVERGRGEPVHARRPARVVQSATVRAASAPVEEGVQPVDELGEPADQLEVAVAHVVDGQRAGDLAVVEPGHGRAEQHPAHAGRPGVGVEAAEPEGARGASAS